MAFLCIATVSFGAKNLTVKVVDSNIEATRVLDAYESQWNKQGTFTDQALLGKILKQRGVHDDVTIAKAMVYEKAGTHKMVFVATGGNLYELEVTVSAQMLAGGGCSCFVDGVMEIDLNGDGDTDDLGENCELHCNGPF
ncbi:MAG: hypothetical protein AAGB22_05585 [Bacteroidota bacterium]